MFKTLEIKNFKSIGHAKLDLGKINVITGQSNLGKSNVVQAVYCLVHNHWDSNYMKWGEKKCSVRLTDDSGEWVEYRHNETSAEYSLSSVDQPFTKIGRDVPKPVQDFLNMNCVQFDEDLLLDFNFERQFDPSFVISLSGFELAKVFGKLMNLDIVMTASRNINKDLVALRKNVEAQEAVENVSIDYIRRNYAVELKYALLHKALKLEAEADEMDKENASLFSVLSEISYQSECAEAYSKFLDSDSASLIDSIHEPVQGLDNLIVSIEVAGKAVEAYSSALSKEMPVFDFDRLYGLMNGLVGLVVQDEKRKAYASVLESTETVDLNAVRNLMDFGSVLEGISFWDKEFEEGNVKYGQFDESIAEKGKEFSVFLKENNICPVSGKPFKKGCIESIVGGAV